MKYINEQGRTTTISDSQARKILAEILATSPRIQDELDGHTGVALAMRQMVAVVEEHKRRSRK